VCVKEDDADTVRKEVINNSVNYELNLLHVFF